MDFARSNNPAAPTFLSDGPPVGREVWWLLLFGSLLGPPDD